MTLADVSIDVTTSDPSAFLSPGGLLTTLQLRARHDTLDDIIDPARGRSWSARLEWAPTWLPTDNAFVSIRSDLTRYRPLGAAVAASRLEAGLAAPLGDTSDLLPNRRFFAGGTNGMRGARRRMLGPLDSEGSPIGGRAMLLFSTELRFPVKGSFSGAVFADAGNVWRRREQMALDSVAVAVGPGLMARTPVGPFRADLAFNLRSRPAGEPRIVLNVSIGHPF